MSDLRISQRSGLTSSIAATLPSYLSFLTLLTSHFGSGRRPGLTSMKKILQKNTYSQLVEDITALYGLASRALVEAYWQIGKRIVEQEQQGETNAVYGDHLLTRLFRRQLI